jgi:hypothetical protein
VVNSSTIAFYTDAKLQSEVVSLFSLSLSFTHTCTQTHALTHSLTRSFIVLLASSLPPSRPPTSRPFSLYLHQKIRLKRPITDCEGRALIVGDNDIPRFGEITFFPRQLSTQEMVEIRSAGFTFESLAAGKMPSVPVRRFLCVLPRSPRPLPARMCVFHA